MQDRDVIAMHMLASIIAAQAHPQSDGAVPVEEGAAIWLAKFAYVYADALLTASQLPVEPAGAPEGVKP